MRGRQVEMLAIDSLLILLMLFRLRKARYRVYSRAGMQYVLTSLFQEEGKLIC